MALKYGKLPPQEHRKSLVLSDYVTPDVLPPPPFKKAWEYIIPNDQWGMLGNDAVGDCVIAMILHFIMMATASTLGKAANFTTEIALAVYSAITGYNPSDPSTDQGTVMTDALNYWQTTGITDADGNVHKILGWAKVAIDLNSIKQGIAIFGAVLIGTNVTSSMEQQFAAGTPWNPPFSNDSVGGHGIPWPGYGRVGQACITWATVFYMSPEMVSQVDEAYVVITQDWLDAQGQSPSGLDLRSLQADLKLIAA